MYTVRSISYAFLLVLVVVLVFSAASAALSYTYSGTVSWTNAPSQIVATHDWAANGTSLFWGVTDLGGGLWDYYYNFSVPAKNISHLVLETTKPITGINVTLGDLSNDSPNDWTSSNGNPGIPSSL